MSFCDPQIEGIRKSALSIEVPLCCNTFFSIKRCSVLSSRSQSEELYFHENTPSKKWLFCALRDNPDIPNFPKRAIVIDISRHSNCFFFNNYGFDFIWAWNEDFTRLKETLIKNHFYWSMSQVSGCPRVQKKQSNLDFSRFSNSNFSETTGLISFIKVSMEKHTHVEKYLIRNPLSLILASGSWESENAEKCFS